MFIDLTVTLNAQTPVYPGDPPTAIEPAGVLERDGWNDVRVSFGTHIGTHVDAPFHMLADGKKLDEIPVEQFIGRGRMVEVKEPLTLESLEQADVQEGDIVLFRTGMSERYHKPIYFEDYPIMSEEIARWLVERKVKMVGVDACSVANQDDFPIHKILLAGDVFIAENLTDLGKLTGKDFKVYALPIKLDGDGAPARVVAEIA